MKSVVDRPAKTFCECVLRGTGSPLPRCRKCFGTGELKPASIHPPPRAPLPSGGDKRRQPRRQAAMKTTPAVGSTPTKQRCSVCNQMISEARFAKHMRKHRRKAALAAAQSQAAKPAAAPPPPPKPAPNPEKKRSPVRTIEAPPPRPPPKPAREVEVVILRNPPPPMPTAIGGPAKKRKKKKKNGKPGGARSHASPAPVKPPPAPPNTTARRGAAKAPESIRIERPTKISAEATREYHDANVRGLDGRYDSTPLHDDFDDDSSP